MRFSALFHGILGKPAVVPLRPVGQPSRLGGHLSVRPYASDTPGIRVSPRTPTGGFTLVEILVAMVVGGIALAAGFGALSILQERTSHAREVGTVVLEEAAIRELLLDWLGQATMEVPAGATATPLTAPEQGGGGRGGGGGLFEEAAGQGLRASQGQGQGATAGQGGIGGLGTFSDQPTAPTSTFEGQEADDLTLVADELYFLTSAETPLDLPTTFIRLYLDIDPLTPEQGWVAELTGRRIDEIPRRIEIAPQATGVEIRYLPNLDGEVEWQDGWVGQNTLPRGIEIRLLSDPSNPLPGLLALPIRAVFEAIGSTGQTSGIFRLSGSFRL